MPNALITSIAGQDGGFLVNQLLKRGHNRSCSCA